MDKQIILYLNTILDDIVSIKTINNNLEKETDKKESIKQKKKIEPGKNDKIVPEKNESEKNDKKIET
tara:strand:+ start:119 stop:319 length:201 start_codon:yes stop_codon:yes gene_type:complete